MSAFEYSKNWMKEANNREFSQLNTSLNYISEVEYTITQNQRDEEIKQLCMQGVSRINGNTKLFSGTLSPGCTTCAAGAWSCLFINGICNANCFYCPAPQDDASVPSTNLLQFTDPREFADYVAHFGFKGVSISGGEPLLTLERTTSFIKTIKDRFADTVHFWMYTNGKLMTSDIASHLADLGVDEVRFDIGATDYNLDKARLAVGKIQTVTVEIPAVPEEESRLKQKMQEMQESGINHLNLHQMRLTTHNARHLLNRKYTYLHGPKVAVRESEQTALNLLGYSQANKSIPVNYCTTVFKHRYQKQASRTRAAYTAEELWESTTANGYIRRIICRPHPETAHRLDALLQGKNPTRWQRLGNDVILHPHLLDARLLPLGEWFVQYYNGQIRQNITYRHAFRNFTIGGRAYVVEKQRVTPEMPVSANELKAVVEGTIEPRTEVPQQHTNADVINCLEVVQGELTPHF